MIGIWFFAIIWIAISSAPLLMLETELNKQNYAALLVLLFPLGGFVFIKKSLEYDPGMVPLWCD